MVLSRKKCHLIIFFMGPNTVYLKFRFWKKYSEEQNKCILKQNNKLYFIKIEFQTTVDEYWKNGIRKINLAELKSQEHFLKMELSECFFPHSCALRNAIILSFHSKNVFITITVLLILHLNYLFLHQVFK